MVHTYIWMNMNIERTNPIITCIRSVSSSPLTPSSLCGIISGNNIAHPDIIIIGYPKYMVKI